MKHVFVTLLLLSVCARADVYNLDGWHMESSRSIIKLDNEFVYADNFAPVFPRGERKAPLVELLPTEPRYLPDVDAPKPIDIQFEYVISPMR